MNKLIILILISFMVPGIMGCNKAKRVSGKEFQNIYETRHHNTMHASKYLGHRDGKVYILRESKSLMHKEKWNKQIFYTDISELDSSFKTQLLENSKELRNIEY